MASDASFVQFVVDQVTGAGAITTRFMFGDYALYCNEKVVGLICDNKLFVKPTDGGRLYIGTPVEAPAYTGAKPSFLIEEKLEDRAWITELIRITEREVSAPVSKGSRKTATAAHAAQAATAKPANETAKSRATVKSRTPAATKGQIKTHSKTSSKPKAKPKAKSKAQPKSKPHRKPTTKPKVRTGVKLKSIRKPKAARKVTKR